MKAPAGVVLLGALTACFKPVFNNPRCGPNGECPSGTECVDGLCVGDIAFDANDTDGALDDGGATDGRTDAAADAPPGPQPFAGCQNDTGLALCFRFETGSPQLHDGSQYQNDGTTPAGITSVTGKVGSALSFSGSNSGFTVPPDPSLDVTMFTVEAWVNLTVPPPGGGRYGIIDRDVSYGMFYYFDGTVRCYVDLDNAMVSVGVLPTGQWFHLACSYDGNTFRIYKNGVLMGTQNLSAGTPPPGTQMAIGRNMPSGDNLRGVLDEVKVWRRQLSQTDICNEVGC